MLLGSFLLSDQTDGFYPTFFGESDKFDAFDLHLFGTRNEDHFADCADKINFVRQQTPLLPIWMTETSTYTDTPQREDGSSWPYQSELDQAVEVVKRYVHLGYLNLEKILWGFLKEGPDGAADGFFWYTGLIYDGQGQYDRGNDVKKLSYFTYKLMVEKLGDADWDNITSVSSGDNVYQYLFMKDGAPAYVVWYDWFNDTVVPKQVTLDVSHIRTGLVRITKAIPSFETGEEADTVPFEEAFESYRLPITNGTVVIYLDREPVFIEECGGCICDLNNDGICDEQDLIIFGGSHGWGDLDCNEPGVECLCDLVRDDNSTCDGQDSIAFLEAYYGPECRLAVYIERLKPKPCVPGDKIRIIGSGIFREKERRLR